MPREDYQERLNDLQIDVEEMADAVLDRFELSLKAFREDDTDLAWQVIDGDAEVNELYLEIEQDCVDLIALQQPVAGDLRLIAASFKIITDLERIADLATNIGDYTKEAHPEHFTDIEVQEIGGYAERMVADGVEAYSTRDPELCYEVDERDDRLDDMCEKAKDRVIRRLIETGEVDTEEDAQEMMREATRNLLVIRDLERVGDHAVNIAARTLYMIESNDELIW